jgi:hypothetical protein
MKDAFLSLGLTASGDRQPVARATNTNMVAAYSSDSGGIGIIAAESTNQMA